MDQHVLYEQANAALNSWLENPYWPHTTGKPHPKCAGTTSRFSSCTAIRKKTPPPVKWTFWNPV